MLDNISGDGRVLISEPENTNEVHIHVTGYRLPSSVYLRILDVMKMFHEKKPIVFVVYDMEMMVLIRESIPLSFFERVELRNPACLADEEGLRRAG